MTDMNYTERDWKLFRERIAAWQESYIPSMFNRNGFVFEVEQHI